MKTCLALLCLLCAGLAQAATYYVATTGSNSNPGTEAQPWLTVQHAADLMVAGDTVIVQTGTYAERVTESTSGTAGSRITYTTNGVVSVGGFVLTGAYVTLDGFYLTGAGGGAQFISVQNHNEIIRNISILKPAHSSVWGVYVGVGYTNCYIDHLVTENIWYPNVMLDGSYCTVTNTSITSTTSWDAFRIGGSNNKIVGCAVTMTRGSNEEHTDLVQCGTAPGSVATNNILENNLFGPFDSNVQLSMIDDDTTGHAAAWIFRNNVYLGPSGIMHIQIPGCMFYNNVFYHIDTAFGSCISLSGDPGWAYANNTVFRNNIWYECGVSSGLSPYEGWYSIGSGITGTDSDYNLVIGTGAGTTKVGFATGGREAHSLNGVSPLFVNAGSLLAAGYKLQDGSPCLNSGTTIANFNFDRDGTSRPQGAAWDMGAYESGGGEPPDTTPPTPDPMTWNSVPAAISSSAITMVASTASDANNGILYYFDETSGHAGGSDSGWQASTSYTDSGLSASTLYTYRVRARDATLNETAWSSSQNATTDAEPDITPPSPDPMTWSSVPTAISTSAMSMTATTATDAGGAVDYYFDPVSGGPGATPSGWQSSAAYTDSGLSAATLYTYRVRARDATLNETAWSSSQNATTDAEPPPIPPLELRATTVNVGSIRTP